MTARDVIADYMSREVFDPQEFCEKCDDEGRCTKSCNQFEIDCLGHTDAILTALRADGFAVVKEKELSILKLVATEAEEWCRCIKENGSGWDDWDSCYKTMEWELLPALKAAQGGTE